MLIISSETDRWVVLPYELSGLSPDDPREQTPIEPAISGRSRILAAARQRPFLGSRKHVSCHIIEAEENL